MSTKNVSARILVVDDEEDIRFSLQGILEDEGHLVWEAATGEKAWEILLQQEMDLLFLDIWLPGIDGLEVLNRVRQEYNETQVIMISGHGNIETAVEAIKSGAFDFIEKPLSLEKVIITANKALEFCHLKRENLDLRSRIKTDPVQEISGKTESIQNLRLQIARVAPTESWVLISGQNGTGKEIVARNIHMQSKRAKKPMIAVNCAAIPDELIESELFGHEKGAFTGADKNQSGKFEMANHGTLFLDEIGDMSLKTQAKILRILQEQCFERVGGRKTISVNVRVIAATNKDLHQEIQEGRFRQDLYYRLKVFPLHVPELRQRLADIPVLIDEFVQSLTYEHGFKEISFSSEALQALMEYEWPGNVRELKNFVERMLIMYPGQQIKREQLPAEMIVAQEPNPAQEANEWRKMDFKTARSEFERYYLESKLAEFKGNISRLAEDVGLERSYLYRKLKSYGILSRD